MNPNQQIPMPADEMHEIETNDLGSVDDFLRELEEKEKDLHITSDLSIEIEDSDVGADIVPEMFVSMPPIPRPQRDLTAETGAVSSAVGEMDERVPRLRARISELEKEIAELNQTLREVRSERNEIQEKSDRRVKDFENFKYRMDRERRGSFIEQLANMASQMLPVLDNLDRALNTVPASDTDGSKGRNEFYDGIFLVNQQLNDVLMSMGIEPIATKDQPFDPSFHEAVATEEDESIPHNTIVGELLRGYRIGNRVVRHSMVKVAVSSAPKSAQSVPAENKIASDDAAQTSAVSAEELMAGIDAFAHQALTETSPVAVDASPEIAESSEPSDDGGLSSMLERFDSNDSQNS